MLEHRQLYIGGSWVAPHGNGCIAVDCPADGSVLATIPEGNAADVAAAVAAAREAFPGWAATPAIERAALLKQVQEAMKLRGDEIARTISSEMGAPLAFSQRVQLASPAATFSMYAKLLADFPFADRVGHSLVLREPAGGGADQR